MFYFKNNCIDLTNQKNIKDLLIRISNSIFLLSKSPVFNNRISIGGIYHKNYYDYICSGFFNGQNIIYNQKNIPLSEFLYNLKHNLCNFGLYFIKENSRLYLKIYSGNTFALNFNQQNYIESFIAKKEKLINNCIEFNELENFYEQKYIKKLKPFSFEIDCKNSYLQKQIKKFKLSVKSDIKVIIDYDLTYQIFDKNNREIKKEKLFKYFQQSNLSDDEIIKSINLTNQKKVVNKNFLLYNDLTNNFDIFKTLKYISWRIANDKNYPKLV